MLASITPLGERSRRQNWPLTTLAFFVGATSSGIAVGAALGALGWPLRHVVDVPVAAWLMVLAGVLAVGGFVDATGRRRWMPTPRRQVNENWLTRYRGWVYGISFGAQLGVGFTTYVTSAAFYAAACAAVASGSLAAGALIMGTFGAFRGASVFSTAKVKTSPAVYRFARRLLVLDRPTARLTTALEVSLGLALATYGALQFG